MQAMDAIKGTFTKAVIFKEAETCRKEIIQEFSTLKATPVERTINQQSNPERDRNQTKV